MSLRISLCSQTHWWHHCFAILHTCLSWSKHHSIKTSQMFQLNPSTQTTYTIQFTAIVSNCRMLVSCLLYILNAALCTGWVMPKTCHAGNPLLNQNSWETWIMAITCRVVLYLKINRRSHTCWYHILKWYVPWRKMCAFRKTNLWSHFTLCTGWIYNYTVCKAVSSQTKLFMADYSFRTGQAEVCVVDNKRAQIKTCATLVSAGSLHNWFRPWAFWWAIRCPPCIWFLVSIP